MYDDAFFYQNADLRNISYLWKTWFEPSLDRLTSNAHYRPLTFVTFSLNYLFTGESPVWFHLVNICLNGIACTLLFIVMRRLWKNDMLAWLTVIFFALMPIHVESIAYIKARDELLVGVCGFAAWNVFLASIEGKKHKNAYALFAAVFSLCAFLSKESALVLPGVFAGVLFLMRGWRMTLKAWLPIMMQACAIVVFFVLRDIAVGHTIVPDGEILYFGQNPLGYMAPRFVPWTAVQLFFIAVGQTFVPWNLSATYGFAHVPIISSPFESWMAIPGVLIAILLITFVCFPRTRSSPLGVGALTFLVLYFPFSKIPFYHSIDFFAERWLYAPSAGLAMIGGYGAWHLWKNARTAALTVLPAIAVAYLFVLIPRTYVWLDATRLGESMVRDAPNSVISYVFLANNRLQYGRIQEGTALVTQGLSITREHVPIHHVAAALALSAGELQVAELATAAAEELGGDELANVILRSTLLAKEHRYQESLHHLQGSKWFDPHEHRTRMLLALNLWMLDRHDEARQYFDWDKNLPVIKLTDEEKISMFETY